MDPGLWVEQGLAAGGAIAVPLAFVGGVVMGLNPCCLVLYPAAAASCCAGVCHEPRRPALSHALLFVLGTATAMTILGMSAAFAGQTMGAFGGWVPFVVAVVPTIMGIALLGGFRIRTPIATGWTQQGRAGAFLTGLLLSLVISPCGTPALAVILSFAAYKGSPAFGALLLFAYGIGNGLPLLIVGTAAGEATKRLQRLGWTQWVNRGAGVGMLGLGVYLFFVALRS